MLRRESLRMLKVSNELNSTEFSSHIFCVKNHGLVAYLRFMKLQIKNALTKLFHDNGHPINYNCDYISSSVF